MSENGSIPIPPACNKESVLRLAHRFTHNAMATVFEIACMHEDAAYAGKAAQAAFDRIDRIETELSRHRSSSDISRIGHLESGSATQVGPWTMECLLMATYFYQETQGAFDISLGSGLATMELMPRQLSVRAHKYGVRLDLGGIGKGYAIDRAAELLEEWGISRALLHGGFSSVLALDAPPECDGWPLTISLPGAGSTPVLRRISAQREAWSGSGNRKKDHIVDPRSGTPVRHRPAAWVSGKREALAAVFTRQEITGLPEDFFGTGGSPSAVAEALSTAFMIMPLDEIASFCLKHPGIEAHVLSSDPSNPASTPVLASFTR
jgi:thiamine biosynthesis lipoprotein